MPRGGKSRHQSANRREKTNHQQAEHRKNEK